MTFSPPYSTRLIAAPSTWRSSRRSDTVADERALHDDRNVLAAVPGNPRRRFGVTFLALNFWGRKKFHAAAIDRDRKGCCERHLEAGELSGDYRDAGFQHLRAEPKAACSCRRWSDRRTLGRSGLGRAYHSPAWRSISESCHSLSPLSCRVHRPSGHAGLGSTLGKAGRDRLPEAGACCVTSSSFAVDRCQRQFTPGFRRFRAPSRPATQIRPESCPDLRSNKSLSLCGAPAAVDTCQRAGGWSPKFKHTKFRIARSDMPSAAVQFLVLNH